MTWLAFALGVLVGVVLVVGALLVWVLASARRMPPPLRTSRSFGRVSGATP